MRPMTTIAAAALIVATGAGATGAALADSVRCPAVAAQQWMPIEKVIERAEALGYSVHETKRSKGCWKVEGYDRNGAEIEIRFDPSSGEVVKPNHWRVRQGW
ncbi:MAG TPA: PepSY domain-containing protein [Pseudolabrys sp.]|nr:PepSY domain-containing protein [Pseudolabrys sp.]